MTNQCTTCCVFNSQGAKLPCQRLRDDAPSAAWHLAAVLWPISSGLLLNATSSILAGKSPEPWGLGGLCLPISPRPLGWFVDLRHGEHFVQTDGHFWIDSRCKMDPRLRVWEFNGPKRPGAAPRCPDPVVWLCCYAVAGCKRVRMLFVDEKHRGFFCFYLNF